MAKARRSFYMMRKPGGEAVVARSLCDLVSNPLEVCKEGRHFINVLFDKWPYTDQVVEITFADAKLRSVK